MLQAFHVYVSIIKEQSSTLLASSKDLVELHACVVKNLASHARLVRMLTLKILAAFEKMDEDGEQVWIQLIFY